MEEISKLIRNVPDFPKPGIIFKDITTLLSNPEGFKKTVDALAEPFVDKGVDYVVGIEARGFIFAAVLAYKLGAGLTIVRKPGKLPYKTVEKTYDLEYGTDTVQMHEDAFAKGDNVLIVDDLLATGGTVQAVTQMVREVGANIVACAFVIELDFLNGREKLEGQDIHTLIHY